METTRFTERIRSVAQAVEKFVEHNLIEKEQRDENLKKLALAFEALLQKRTSDFDIDTTAVRVALKTHKHFKGDLPAYQSQLAAGMDVRAQLDEPIVLQPGQRALIPTGISVSIPAGYEIQARPRSGWAIRDGITLLNSPGTIDADYRGEIKIVLINHGQAPVEINDQERIAQLVLTTVSRMQFEHVDQLDETNRGGGGFGSTGRA